MEMSLAPDILKAAYYIVEHNQNNHILFSIVANKKPEYKTLERKVKFYNQLVKHYHS